MSRIMSYQPINRLCQPLLVILSITSALLLSACGGSTDEPDPIAVDVPIAYVDRPLYTEEDINDTIDPEPVLVDIENPREFNGGARLILRTNPTRTGDIRDITDLIFNDNNVTVDIKDLSPSPDGKKFVFAAMLEPLPTQQDDEQKWDIWEYDLEEDTVTRLITSGTFAQEAHDISPAYLPDNRTIVFASTRQDADFQVLVAETGAGANKTAFFSLTESGDAIENGLGIGPKFNLHTLDTETQIVTQITFNRSHDLQPTVLPDGRIAFLRWDNHPNKDSRQSIYTINPDGSNLSLLYGYHSQQSVNTSDGDANTTFFDLAATSDGRLLAVRKQQDNSLYPNFDEDTVLDDEATNPFLGGELISINYKQFTEINQRSNSSAGSGSGQQSELGTAIDISNAISIDGYVNSAYPANDSNGRIIYSRTPCRVRDENSTEILRCTGNIGEAGIVEADPFYSLWQFDPDSGTRELIQPTTEGRMITDVIAINEITRPTLISTNTPDPDSETGILHIESIYDFDGVLANTPNDASLSDLALPSTDPNSAFRQREARFIRVTKAVSEPDEDTFDFDAGIAQGVSGNDGFLEILGYAPIEPDGSVAVKIPSNVAFKFDIVDANGQRLSEFPAHLNWLSLVTDEVYHCTGCHMQNSEAPHGRRDAQPASINAGAPAEGLFPGTNVTTAAGWTMATAWAARNTSVDSNTPDIDTYASARELLPDLIYEDEWSLVSIPEESVDLRYVAANPPSPDNLDPNVAEPPSSDGCLFNWTAHCRIIINYESHIQPIWEEDRISGADNYNCVSCHTSNGNSNVPAGLLELTDDPINDFILSYDELFDGRNNLRIPDNLAYRFRMDPDTGDQLFLQELDDKGNADPLDDELVDVKDPGDNPIPLVDKLTTDDQNDAIANEETIYIQEVDSDGNFVFIQDSNGTIGDTTDDTDALDAGNRIPSLVAYTGPIGPRDNIDNFGRLMELDGAANSRFFDLMLNQDNIANNVFNHTRLNQDDPLDTTPLMTPHELRLISEWLDIGAQYYNNPFDAPLDN